MVTIDASGTNQRNKRCTWRGQKVVGIFFPLLAGPRFSPVETIPHLTDRMDPPQSGRKPCGSNGSDATPSIDVCNVTTNGNDGKGLWRADAKFKLSLNSSNECHS